MGGERVVHAAIGLERAKLVDGLRERVGHVTGLGGGVVTVTDVDLAVGLLVVADDEDEVVCRCAISRCNNCAKRGTEPGSGWNLH